MRSVGVIIRGGVMGAGVVNLGPKRVHSFKINAHNRVCLFALGCWFLLISYCALKSGGWGTQRTAAVAGACQWYIDIVLCPGSKGLSMSQGHNKDQAHLPVHERRHSSSAEVFLA